MSCRIPALDSRCFSRDIMPISAPPIEPRGLRRFVLLAMLLSIQAGVVQGQDSPSKLKPQAVDHFEKSIRPVLVKTCADCHHPSDPDNHVHFLKATQVSHLAENRKLWRNVATQLRNRTMPPADKLQPTEDDRFRIANWIDETLRASACQQPDFAGHITTRRLNRQEYDNTVRDLVGLDLELSLMFPADGSGGEGFDNNGETLFLPPLLMERYLEAAQKIVDTAIITPPLNCTIPHTEFLPVTKTTLQDQPVESAREVQPGKPLRAVINAYLEGVYNVELDASAASETSKLILKVDGLPAQRFDVLTADADRETTSEKPSTLKAAIRLRRGMHVLELVVPKNASTVRFEQLKIQQSNTWVSKERRASHGKLLFEKVGDTPESQRQSARTFIAAFMRKAFRRPVNVEEIDTFLTLYDRAASRNDPFEERVKLALKAVLVSPHFLFRIEKEPTGREIEKVTNHELATRLAYFLWSTMPDAELSRVADAGRLREDDVLREQLQRMLADPKAKNLARDFTGQWLGTRDVGGRVAPDTNFYKTVYSQELARDLREEGVLLMHHILQENRSLLELIDADYTFLNRRLAKHYGLKIKVENRLEKVSLNNGQRGGVLGLGAVHILTSQSRRTSPVLRGAWVLETLLGTKVPSPAANIPPLNTGKKKNGKTLSLRATLLEHRADKSCAACHNLIDPIGFGMENYDVLGRWRDTLNKKKVDVTGTLPSGESFDGPAELKQVLLTKKDEFIRHLVEKMLGYSLGRSLADEDQCTVQKLTDRLQENGFRSRELIEGIVFSTPFRNKQRVEEK